MVQGLIRFANLSSMSLSISGSIYNELNGLFLILLKPYDCDFSGCICSGGGCRVGTGRGFQLALQPWEACRLIQATA